MFGFKIDFKKIITKAIIDANLNEGKLKKHKHKPGKRPAPLSENFDISSGLASLVTIRDVHKNPFITLEMYADYLTLLAAFHQLQIQPDFMRRLEGYAIDYKKYAQFTVPRHRAMVEKVAETIDPDSLLYSFPGQLSRCSVSPVTTFYGSVRLGGMVPSFTASECSTLVDTPLTGRSYSDGYFIRASPLTYLPPTAKVSDSQSNSVDDSPASSEIEKDVFFTPPVITPVNIAPGSTDLPLPPIGVLLAWHAHLMRPDLYTWVYGSGFDSLWDVPFPLKKAAEAIRQGALPLELALCNQCEWPSEEYRPGVPATDIPALINNQTVFVDYCHQAGLFKEGLLEKNSASGKAAIVRYHAFMELMKTVEGNHRLEHTLDIEVAWKCHRLNHQRYCTDVLGFAERDYFKSCSYRRERWSTTAHFGYDYKKETQKAWGKRFKGQKLFKTA